MLIPCPHCGPRDSGEFAYRGDATKVRPALDADQNEWCDYLFQRANPMGLHREYWQHTGGCRAVFAIVRNVVTHEVQGGEGAGEPVVPVLEPVLEPAE